MQMITRGLFSKSFKRIGCIRFQSGSYPSYTKIPTHMNTILNIVPQQQAWVVERFGKFFKVLEPGLQILLPMIDKIRYVHSLKEQAVNIAEQTAITKDNVTLTIDGVLFYQVIDPFKASYEIENHDYAIKQLAQTTMRSEIGKLALDDVFKERDTLNMKIVDSIRSAAVKWGIECMRYEIKDVQPPTRVLEAMQMQVEAERKKRAAVLESEGLRESAINKATGQAQALTINANSRAFAIKAVSDAMGHKNSEYAVSYAIAQQYIEAFEKLAKETNTVILPKNLNDISSCISEAVSIYNSLTKQNKPKLSNETVKNLNETESSKKKVKELSDEKNISNMVVSYPSTWRSKI